MSKAKKASRPKKQTLKKLRVLTGRPGSFEIHDRVAVSDKARESIQSHIVLERFPAYALARQKLSRGYSFEIDEGLLKVRLNDPITEDDHRFMIVEGKKAVGDHNGAAHYALGYRAPLEVHLLNVISETTKMGCYSFNLPAGPTPLGGTCPGSGPGFLFLTPAEQVQQRRKMIAPIEVKERDWLCSGCYALKNSYGNPSQIMYQAMRYMMTLEWLNQGTFVENMVRAIQQAGQTSTQRRKKLPPSLRWTVPDPKFFRIHDSGDFFNAKYARAWFDVCKALPDVKFWAPTRMWSMATSDVGRTVFTSGVPANLALRPSGLHFGESAPRVDNPGTREASVGGAALRLSLVIPGLSSGSGSGKAVPPGAWRCPAYDHISKLGGLGPRVSKKKGERGRPKLTKAGDLTEAEGTCARAHGPLSPKRGGTNKQDTPTQGSGCRACWVNKEIPIFYQEH